MVEHEHEVVGPGEAAKSALSGAIAGAIIGAIVGVLLSLFAIFSLGFAGLLGTLVLGLVGAIIGFIGIWITTFTWYSLPPWLKKPITYLIVILIVVLIAWVGYGLWHWNMTSEYLKFASPVTDSIGRGWHDFRTSWGACINLKPPCPFLIDWETPNVQSAEEELSVNVVFSDTKIDSNNKVNLLASITVKNPELTDLHIKPKCYLGKNKSEELQIGMMGSYSYGDEFVFGRTSQGQELHTSLRCTGDISEASDKNVYSDIVVLTLERPVSVKTTWPIQIGQEPKMGLVKSEMKFNAPYTIAMTSDNDMPFAEGREYDFQIVLKRRQEDARLAGIEYINVKYSDDISASCENGFEGIDHEIELAAYSYDALKNLTQFDSQLDKFSWPCSLYVSAAPQQAVLSPMELEAKYNVYSDYTTRIVKST